MRSTAPARTTHRRRWLWVTLAAAWVLPAATMAWACVVVATTQMSPSSGPVGTAVTVTGSDWPTDRPVEIRWGSSTGPLLGSGRGPNFSTTVHIPDADPGDYNVVARATFDNGSTADQQSMAFRVTAPVPATTTTTVPPAATTTTPTTTLVAEQAPAPTPWPYQATGTAAEPAAATQPGPQASSAGPSGAAAGAAPAPTGVTPTAARGVSPAQKAPPPAAASSGAAPDPIAAGAVVTPAVDVAGSVAVAAPTAAAGRRLAAGTPAALRGLPEHDDSSPSPILLVGAVVLAATTIAGLVVRARRLWI